MNIFAPRPTTKTMSNAQDEARKKRGDPSSDCVMSLIALLLSASALLDTQSRIAITARAPDDNKRTNHLTIWRHFLGKC